MPNSNDANLLEAQNSPSQTFSPPQIVPPELTGRNLILPLSITFALSSLFSYFIWDDFITANKLSIEYNATIIYFFILFPLTPSLVYLIRCYADKKFPSINSVSPEDETQDKNQGEVEFNLVQNIKSITQFISIILSITFSFVLLQNIVIMNRNIGAAIHLTSKQFTEYKYEWATLAFILIAIIYLTFIPQYIFSFLRRYIFKFTYKLLPINPQETLTIIAAYIIMYVLLYILPLVIIIASIENTIIEVLALPKGPTTALFVLIFTSISFTTGNLKILSEELKTPSISGKKFWTYTLAALFIFTSTNIYLSPTKNIRLVQSGGISLGATISSPSKSLNHLENTPYSCVFSSKTSTPEPIAFGILVSSKDSSVNIFSPQRDSITGDYAYKAEDGRLYPYLLNENHVKTPEAYYIEKYDKSKHWIDPKTGKCNYREIPPFHEYKQVKSKLIIRNIT